MCQELFYFISINSMFKLPWTVFSFYKVGYKETRAQPIFKPEVCVVPLAHFNHTT
jgi:hypothetical protein